MKTEGDWKINPAAHGRRSIMMVTYTGFLQVRENWKKSGNLCG